MCMPNDFLPLLKWTLLANSGTEHDLQSAQCLNKSDAQIVNMICKN